MFRSRYISAKLSDLSTYRTQLMGIATLMVIICHANAYHVQLPRLVVSIFTWGNLGVDIFLFLSGIGLYYSLSKRNINKKEDYLSFYKKRFFRIYIPYLMICLPYCLIFILLGIYSLGDCILCLSTLGYWLFHRGAWFVSIILILYLVAPFLLRILSGSYSSTSILHNTQFAFGRVPSFILGITIGSRCKGNMQLSVQQILLYCLVFIVTSLFVGVWKCAWLIAPIMSYVFISLLKLVKDSWIDKSLKLLGTISLESYLTNITIKSLLGALAPIYFTSSVFYGHYLEYCIVIVAGLLIAYYVHGIAQRIVS